MGPRSAGVTEEMARVATGAREQARDRPTSRQALVGEVDSSMPTLSFYHTSKSTSWTVTVRV